jgi:hypothetical protein
MKHSSALGQLICPNLNQMCKLGLKMAQIRPSKITTIHLIQTKHPNSHVLTLEITPHHNSMFLSTSHYQIIQAISNKAPRL